MAPPSQSSSSSSATESHSVARVINKARDEGGLSFQDIASIVGVGQRQVQNWAAGRSQPADNKRLRMLLDLQYVLDLLGEIYTAEGGLLWLHARNRTLAGARPVELLTEGRADEVIELLDQLADGNL